MSQENVEVVRRGLEAFNQGDIEGRSTCVTQGRVRATAKGPLSGISDKDFPAGQQLTFVWTLRGGLVIRQEMFSSKADALEAVGLRE